MIIELILYMYVCIVCYESASFISLRSCSFIESSLFLMASCVVLSPASTARSRLVLKLPTASVSSPSLTGIENRFNTSQLCHITS